MFRNLLVAVDGSEHARRAIAVAGDIARQVGAKVTLLHVLTHPAGYQVPEGIKAFNKLEHIRVTEHDILESVGREILATAQEQALQAGAGNVGTLLETGDPTTFIAEVVKKKGIDLVIMGRRGLGDLSGLLLGSVSHKVAQAVDCSCLTIR